MPASFPVPTRTSLGHFRPAVTPVTSATASTTATPVSSGSQPHASLGTAPTPTPTDSAICDRGGVDQLRPCLPRPAVWTRRSAPRRRCPHLRRPAPAGRRWWSRSLDDVERATAGRPRQPTSRTRGWAGDGHLSPTAYGSIASIDHDEQHQGHRGRRADKAPTTAEPSAEHQIDIHTTAGKLADLRKRAEETLHPVGEAAVEKVHAKGKLTARERILALLDEGSFVELDALAKHRSTNFGLAENRPLGDGVVTGYGTIDGRDVCIFSQDATVFGGSLGEVYGEKIVKVQELAIKTGRPLIGINDGAGARIQEGVVSLGLYSKIFHNNILASGVIPQISLIMGAAAGGHVYSPALTDFVIMVDQTSQMFITGPDVIKTVTGEDVTMEELGGAHTHMAKSGLAHYVASGEQDAFDYVRDLLSYLPSNNYADPPRYPAPRARGRASRTTSPTRTSSWTR